MYLYNVSLSSRASFGAAIGADFQPKKLISHPVILVIKRPISPAGGQDLRVQVEHNGHEERRRRQKWRRLSS